MSENIQASSFVPDEYIEVADEIRVANHVNGKQMDLMFNELVIKVTEYQDRCRKSETKVDAMKNIIANQFQANKLLLKQLEETTRKLRIAESKAQIYENKYNRMFSKMKSVILDAAADNGGAWTQRHKLFYHYCEITDRIVSNFVLFSIRELKMWIIIYSRNRRIEQETQESPLLHKYIDVSVVLRVHIQRFY